MSMSFIINKRRIFKNSGGILTTLYWAMEEFVYTENIALNNKMSYFMRTLDELNRLLPYFDIENFIKTSEGMNIFLSVFNYALKKVQYQFAKHVVTDLWNYSAELIKYRDELTVQGK